MSKRDKSPIRAEIVSFRCYHHEKARIVKAARDRKMTVGTFLKIAVLEKLEKLRK
jgi:hypothetical protein